MCVHSLEVVARPLSLTRQGIESKKGPSGSRAGAAGRKVPCHGGLRPNTSCRFVSVSSLCASPPSNAEPPTPCSQSLHMSTLDPFTSEWLCFSIKLGNGQSGSRGLPRTAPSCRRAQAHMHTHPHVELPARQLTLPSKAHEDHLAFQAVNLCLSVLLIGIFFMQVFCFAFTDIFGYHLAGS